MSPPSAIARAARPRAPSLRDLAYDAIKHQIITCLLRPGEYVNEAQMSERLGFGRTPVHQALDRLMIEGLVDIMPRKGVVVRSLSLHDLMQVTEARLLNEPHGARLAARQASDRDIARLQDILDRFAPAIAARDIESMITLDRDFHAGILAAGQNAVLEDIVLKLNDRSLRFWFVSLAADQQPGAVLREHQAILDAIRARDADAAEAAMAGHIRSFRHNAASHI